MRHENQEQFLRAQMLAALPQLRDDLKAGKVAGFDMSYWDHCICGQLAKRGLDGRALRHLSTKDPALHCLFLPYPDAPGSQAVTQQQAADTITAYLEGRQVGRARATALVAAMAVSAVLMTSVSLVALGYALLLA